MIPLSRPSIQDGEKRAALNALESGWLTHGPSTQEFEDAFATYIGTRHAAAMNSGTSALFLALVAAGIKGQVILPSFTFLASANAVLTAGATPVLADIDPLTLNIDPRHAASLVTPQTEALMAVHFAGQSADMAGLARLASQHGLLLIEDSAEAIGSEFHGQKTGTFGIGCFSFFPTKNITTGEGGMLTTNDDALVRRVRAYVSHGVAVGPAQRRFPWERVAEVAGFNFRLSNVLAAIGVEQLKRIDTLNEARRRHALALTALLAGTPGVRVIPEAPGVKHVYQMYVIRVDETVDRNRFVMALRASGIEASVHFDPPLHLQPLYRRYSGPLPVTEAACREVASLPFYPDMTRADLEEVATAVRACAARSAPIGARMAETPKPVHRA